MLRSALDRAGELVHVVRVDAFGGHHAVEIATGYADRCRVPEGSDLRREQKG